jgi:hypothetical protein
LDYDLSFPRKMLTLLDVMLRDNLMKYLQSILSSKMKDTIRWMAVFILIFGNGCEEAIAPIVESARYELTFEATWSSATHPTEFPSNPHFSGLIGASHNEDVSLWRVGENATSGIKEMAERGAKTPLDIEIDSLINTGSAYSVISGGGINPSPGAATVTLMVTLDYPMVSIVSMIAPSPDWFVGVSGLRLLEGNLWVDQMIVELFPYDAGTDSGSTYTSPNEPMATREEIRMIEEEPLLTAGSVPPLGTFTFTRLAD